LPNKIHILQKNQTTYCNCKWHIWTEQRTTSDNFRDV